MTAGRRSAAIVTVGTEITVGLRLDTNTREIAAALATAGYAVAEATSVPDDQDAISHVLTRLTRVFELVVVTGGLGPTHDDVTREAAASALGLPLASDPAIADFLERIVVRHREPGAREGVLRQARVIAGARVIQPTGGTAPGQVVSTPAGELLLLPGPPHEMRPMLTAFLADARTSAPPVILRCVGLSESDAQVMVERHLPDDVGFTVLASPGEVQIVLSDEGAGTEKLTGAASNARRELGPFCYSDGISLPETVLRIAARREVSLAVAESCTGGMIASALTSVPGSSEVFLGGVIAYSNDAKMTLLGVDPELVAEHGAVSAEVARAMAHGAVVRLGAGLAVSTTGVAGPGGATADKPLGLVWFGVSSGQKTIALRRDVFGDREGVRTRATATALDLIRRTLLDMEVG